MAIKHSITLSTTEPNNEVGVIKIRQADEQTQTLEVQITENGAPKSYTGLAVYFCAKLGQTAGLGIIEQKLNPEEMTNPANGKLEYTMRAEDWQILGRQRGYFSFRLMLDEHEFIDQFTTRDFTFEVIKSVFSEGVKEVKKDGSTYLWTIEDLIRLFNEYMASGKTDWEEFVEQNREILESVDPGGIVLRELIDARKPFGSGAYATLGERLDSDKAEVSAKLAQIVVNVESFGAVSDYTNETTTGTDNSQAFKDAILEVNRVGGVLFIPSGLFYHEQDIEYPKHIRMQGAVRGGTVIIKQHKDGVYENLNVDDLHITGMWRAEMSIKNAKHVQIDGNIDWYGTYWNRIQIGIVGSLTIDISEGAVNQSIFTGGRISKLLITGTQEKYGWACQAQNNWFMNVDISTGGALQDDEKYDTNYLVNSYSEDSQGKDLIQGNWQIIGNTGDKTPATDIRNHILYQNDAVPSSGQDFISMSTGNMVDGGEWNSLDDKGRPKGVRLTSINGVVVSDSTAPDGSGRALKLTPTSPWASFNIQFHSPINVDIGGGGLVFYLKGDVPVTFEAQVFNGAVNNMPYTRIELTNDWWLYRVIIPRGVISKISVFLLLGDFTDKVTYISGIKATPYKATPLPYYDPSIYNKGVVSIPPTAGIWRKGEYVMNTENTEINGWRCISSDPLEFKAF